MILGFEWLNGATTQEAEEFPTQGRVRLTQSDEEIARWSTDERLMEGDKALYLMDKGFGVQKTSILLSLRHFLQASKSSTLTAVILAQSHKFDESQMNTLGFSLVECLQQDLVPESDFPELLRVSDLVLESDSEVTADTWSAVVNEVLKRMDETLVLATAVPAILRLCEFSRPVYIRRCGAMLLCSIAAAAPRNFPASLLEKVGLLTQDTSYEIRKTMCKVLPRLATDLGNSVQLFPHVETLLLDEELAVKREAVLMLSNFIQLLPTDFVSVRIGPLLTTEVLVNTDEEYRCCYMSGAGRILSMFTSQDSDLLQRLIVAYEYGLQSSEEAKVNGLSSFCEVAQAAAVEVFDARLRPLYNSLSVDPSTKVRKAAAVIFHKLFVFFEGYEEDLKRLADSFLRDEECKWSVIGQIPDWPGTLHSAATFTQLRNTLTATPQWRRQTLLVSTVHRLCSTELSPLLHEYLTPALLSVMKTGGFALRTAATNALAAILKLTFQTAQRQTLIMRLLEDFAQSKLAADRITYVDFSLKVAKSMSAAFFRKHFLRHLVSMSVDPVATVRMKLASGLESVKLAVAGEDGASELLHEAMVRLCDDTCALVSREASDAQRRMMTAAFLAHIESKERAAEEGSRVAFEATLQEYERTVEEKTRRKIIEDIAAKTRATYQKDKALTTKRNSLKIPRVAVATKGRFSFSEDRADSPRASSPKPAKANPRRHSLRK